MDKIKIKYFRKCKCGKKIKIIGVDLCDDCQIEYNAYAANRLLKKLNDNILTTN